MRKRLLSEMLGRFRTGPFAENKLRQRQLKIKKWGCDMSEIRRDYIKLFTVEEGVKRYRKIITRSILKK